MGSNAGLKLAGYVLSCKAENTTDWMQGLAEELNTFAESIGYTDRFYFDGIYIRRH